MGAKQTLLSIVFGTVLAVTPLAAQQPAQQPKVYGGKELKEFVMNYSGKDTLFFRNGLYQCEILFDEYSKMYKKYEGKDSYQSGKKPTIVLDEAELDRALDYKNYVARYKSLDEAVLDITREGEVKLPSMVEDKVKKYFTVALQYFEKAKAGSGQVLIGEARKYVLDCRDIARKVQENAKEENKYGLEYAIRYMDGLLSDVTTAIDLNPGIFRTSCNGIDLFVVSTGEYNSKDAATGYGVDIEMLIFKILADSAHKASPSIVPDDINKLSIFGFKLLESKNFGNKKKSVAVIRAMESNKTKSIDNDKYMKITHQILPTFPECTIDWDNYPQMKNYR